MKKALAIFIALCLMCSSLAVGIVLADSTKEVVVVPAISETDKPAMGSQGDYGGGAKTKVVENNAPLNLGWAMELIKDSGIGKASVIIAGLRSTQKRSFPITPVL